jgi:general secretion pathway protein G
MIVIVIIGVLATAVTVNMRSYLLKAKQNVARSDIASMTQALNTYFSEYGRYPTTEEGLEVLTKPSKKFPERLLDPPLTDPWDQPYQYASAGPRDFEVFSFGADMKEGGTGADADVSSKDLEDEAEGQP